MCQIGNEEQLAEEGVLENGYQWEKVNKDCNTCSSGAPIFKKFDAVVEDVVSPTYIQFFR